MGRLGLGALLSLSVACGGNSERNGAPSEGGSAGTVTGMGGISGILPSGGSAGTVSLGGSSAGGAPGGRESRLMMCDRGTLNYVVEASSETPAGFSGSFDDAPLELVPDDPSGLPELGTITGEVYSCLSSTSTTFPKFVGA